MDKQKKGKLYLIPTPLAENSLDKLVTTQLQDVIKNLDYYLVENVRTARRFISSLKLGITIEELKFEVLDKNSKADELAKLCKPLMNGRNIGVMSEAGCPGIADPGSLAVSYAHKNDLEVIPLVGPSSIFMALMASGLNGQSFAFHGYLPIDKQKRANAIKALERDTFQKKQTQIFMETPFRNNHMLADILKICRQDTKLCIARDITGSHEYIKSQTVKAWRKMNIDLHKVPMIFLLFS